MVSWGGLSAPNNKQTFSLYAFPSIWTLFRSTTPFRPFLASFDFFLRQQQYLQMQMQQQRKISAATMAMAITAQNGTRPDTYIQILVQYTVTYTGIAVRNVTQPHCYENSRAIWHQSVTCQSAEVTFPSLPQPKLVLDLVTRKWCKAELT